MEKGKYNLGGVKMKKRLLIVILFSFGIAATASATEVINIDLNGYNDGNAPPTGTVAKYDDGINQWNVYYGGWGKPMGSPQSADLRNYNEPNLSSTYAAQVWIGDANQGSRRYAWGSGLMDDGFVKDGNFAGDPNIQLFGQDAYQGTFDIYVYGDTVGDFNLTVNGNANFSNITKHVSGGFDGNFVENKNYVIYTGIPIYNPNSVTISYTGDLDALQLVSTKRPQAIYNEKKITGDSYDVAFETNARSGEGQPFGPDIDNTVPGFPGIVVYLDSGEYMEYDITMNDANEGQYAIRAGARTTSGPASLPLSLDGKSLGAVYRAEGWDDVGDTCSVSVNLYGRSEKYVIKWQVPARVYFDMGYLKFTRLGDVNMPDCNAVYEQGFNYAGDLNHDCHVDYKDIVEMTNHWLNCNSPDPNECL
jgi:hypothetical protein